MLKDKLHVSRKILLVTVPVAALVVAGGIVFSASPDGQGPKPDTVKSQASQEQTAVIEAKPDDVTETPTTSVAQTQTPTEPTEPANPYPEGSNMWHAFARRADAGLATPDGPTTDVTYWQGVRESMTKTPTQYAIAFTNSGVQSVVAGVVESVNQDGSLVLSCTNCGQWNVLAQKQIPTDTVASYKFLQ